MTAWLAFLIGGFVTFGMRAAFLLFGADRELPAPFERSLRYVGPAVFAAIVAPAVLRSGETGSVNLADALVDARMLALVIGGLVMWKTRNMLVLLVAGMASLWLLRAAGL